MTDEELDVARVNEAHRIATIVDFPTTIARLAREGWRPQTIEDRLEKEAEGICLAARAKRGLPVSYPELAFQTELAHAAIRRGFELGKESRK